MDLTLDQEQEAIRDAIRALLAERASIEQLRKRFASGDVYDPALWQQAAELGWFGLATPEAHGGAGYGLPEAMLLFIELGRSLTPGPWLGTVIAALALPAGPELTGVLDGRTRVALVDDPADQLGQGTTARGAIGNVSGGDLADAFLVLGATQVRWIAKAANVHVVTAGSIDPTRPLSTVTIDGATATVVPADVDRVREAATVLVSAEAVGVAEQALHLSVEYAKVRVQFGKPIGSFQAIKHRCADMAVRTEVARSTTIWAAVAVRDGATDAGFHCHAAKALAGQAAFQNATDAIQNHGGMGYTWEADPHLYLKRARLLEFALGTRIQHLDALAAPWRAAP
jgi:alkylation response protein AidB-like acyl-CoA dehydrogenase